MMDDPLALVIYGITALAAGMYPVGFLFGACSPCCDECPDVCSKCTHYANNGSACNDYFFGSGRSLTVNVADHGTVTLSNPAYEPCEAAGNEVFVNVATAPVPTWKAGTFLAGQEFTSYADPYICVRLIDGFFVADECGCNLCNVLIGLTARFFYDECPSSSTQFDADFVLSFPGCDVVSQTTSTYTAWVKRSGCNFGEFAPLLAWLNNLSISVSLTIPGCDCGACCDDGCEENVAEGACTAWQGVGVDCDPDPCV